MPVNENLPGYHPSVGGLGGLGGSGYSNPTTAFDTSTPGGISALTEYMNRLNRTGQTAANEARIPGAAGLEATSSHNIDAELHGALPADVIRLLGQNAAERGATTGQGPGGPNEMAAYLQALGLTSIGQQHQGQLDLTAALGRNPAARTFDPGSLVMTDYQRNALRLQTQEARDRAEFARAQLALEQARINAGANAFHNASGGGGGAPVSHGNWNPGAIPTGFGGQYVANSLSPDLITSRSPSERYTPDWMQPGYAASHPSTGTGSGVSYSGTGNLSDDEFYNLTGGEFGGNNTTTGSSGDGLGWNDFMLGGGIASDSSVPPPPGWE